MKNYAQVYVKNSMEAVELYCRAFGAEVTFAIKTEDGTAYEHCELSVNGEPFLAASEASDPCDVSVIHQGRWQTMTFNVFEMERKEVVDNAFYALRDGGTVIEPIHEAPWNKYCATVIDRYGVCWWIAI